MDLNKSGGPMHPTLNGKQINDGEFRWEGMTLFDFYVGQLLLAGNTPATAIKNAAKVLELRNSHLMGETK
jgi:hypothetical protein